MIKEKYPKIDLMIYNAGLFFPSLSWEAKPKNILTLTNVNYISGTQFITTLLPNLEGGHIAVTGSVASIIEGGTYSTT
jgi:short-subunit dehydrogenase